MSSSSDHEKRWVGNGREETADDDEASFDIQLFTRAWIKRHEKRRNFRMLDDDDRLQQRRSSRLEQVKVQIPFQNE